jgi:RNA polymerase sigma-70 factor (ECF subfamily)
LSETVTPFPTAAGAFATTHWSVVHDFSLQKSEPDRANAALAKLCRDYWPPLYRFVRRRGYSPADAEDLTQGFFAYLFEKQAFLNSDRDKGRFRSFLLIMLKRYLAANRAHQSRQKRGGGEKMVFLDAGKLEEIERLDSNALATVAPQDEERIFEWNWATSLVNRAMEALRSEYGEGQKQRIFDELQPFLCGGVGLPTHEAAAERLGVSAETLRSHLFRLRSRYRAFLRTEVLRTVQNEEDIDGELRYLCRILIARS